MSVIEKRYLAADRFLRDSWRLAAQIRKSGWRPDLLLALWRGGAPVGAAVHEYLKVTDWPVDHMPVKCGSYTGIGVSNEEVRFYGAEPLFADIRPGLKVLVVDDVFDTGRTAAAVKAKLDAAGAEMRMACVYWKPEQNLTDLRPDYWVEDVGGQWLVFPHEIEGLTAAEIAEKDPFLQDLMKQER